MADKRPFQSYGTDPKENNNDSEEISINSEIEKFKGIKAFRRVTNSLAAQQRRGVPPETKQSQDSNRAGHNSGQHTTTTRRKKSHDGESNSPFQQSNPFTIKNTSTVMVPDEPSKTPASNMVVKRRGVVVPQVGQAIKRKGALAEQSDLLASFSFSAAAKSAAASNPFAQKNDSFTSSLDGKHPKSKKSLSRPVVSSKASNQYKPAEVNTAMAAKNQYNGDNNFLVPVESLGSGIASALGDAVGGIVNAGKSLGGKSKKKKKNKKPTANTNSSASKPIKPVKYRLSAGSIMSGTVSGGFHNIVYGAGQIVKGGTGIVKGGAGIVVGSLGCLGGAIVCMSGTVKEPLVANDNTK
ncbi:MAG: hypothetical protein HQL71_05940 [Magnetococcales bacterium]|nr:hypothetical protein [Magnetococcales bacterium]